MHVVQPKPTRLKPSCSSGSMSAGPAQVADRRRASPGARLVFTQGFVVSPRSTAFRATRPAATISAGFDVFVHDVIAEMTTDPSPRPPPFRPAPKASVKLSPTRGSETRSCGRRGPARLGSTAERSKSSVSV